MVLIQLQDSIPFRWSPVDLSILKGRDKHLDMNELSQPKTPPIESKLNWLSTSPTAAFYINRKDLVCLVDYSVYQLCMKQLHTRASGLGWEENG